MFRFELSPQMISVISQALGNAPYSVAAPVVTELQRQINEQQKEEVKEAA